MSWHGEMWQAEALRQFTEQGELPYVDGTSRVYSCNVCGALVAYERTILHVEWHESAFGDRS